MALIRIPGRLRFPTTRAGWLALIGAVLGDSGSGGSPGLVPAPSAGDAAAGKFLKADATWAAPAGGSGGLQMNCRLDYVSTTQIKLSRYNGASLWINGTSETIPSAGVTLANTGLTAATRYYIYAYMSSGTMTLEASTTAPAIDSTYGHKIKTGDATRSLVAQVYMDAGTPGTFADAATKRYVISYYNRIASQVQSVLSGNPTTTTDAWVEFTTTMRAQFLHWGDEVVQCATSCQASNSVGSASGYVYCAIIFGTAVGTYTTRVCNFFSVCSAANFVTNISAPGVHSPSEGFNSVTINGGVAAGGTATYNGAYTSYVVMIKK